MIATAVLRDRVTIHPYVGTSGEGADVFGAPIIDEPARLRMQAQVVRTDSGVDVLTVPTCQLRPDVGNVPKQSLVVHGDTAYEVSAIKVAKELGRDHSLILTLTGERPVPGAIPEPPANEPPIASFSVTPSTGQAPLSVILDASDSSDADGTIVSFTWDLGDGETAIGEVVTHEFADGEFTIELTVTDDDGATDTATQSLTVEAAPVPVVFDSFADPGSTPSPVVQVWGNAFTQSFCFTPAVDVELLAVRWFRPESPGWVERPLATLQTADVFVSIDEGGAEAFATTTFPVGPISETPEWLVAEFDEPVLLDAGQSYSISVSLTADHGLVVSRDEDHFNGDPSRLGLLNASVPSGRYDASGAQTYAPWSPVNAWYWIDPVVSEVQP